MTKSYIRLICLNKVIAKNYFIKKKFECGISLKGWEVKSLRKKKVNIENSYVLISNCNQAYMINSIFIPISLGKNHLFKKDRKRKLLLHKKEIFFLKNIAKKKKYTLVVLSIFWKRNWCKVKIALAKGKNIVDKREDLKKKEWDRKKKNIFKKSILKV